jgi:hypothetical protein
MALSLAQVGTNMRLRPHCTHWSIHDTLAVSRTEWRCIFLLGNHANQQQRDFITHGLTRWEHTIPNTWTGGALTQTVAIRSATKSNIAIATRDKGRGGIDVDAARRSDTDRGEGVGKAIGTNWVQVRMMISGMRQRQKCGNMNE